MWVFCCGMWRSGSTLQFQLTARLVEAAGLGKRLEWVGAENFPELRKKYSGYDGLKVIKTHVCTNEMVEEFEKNNAIGVYVFRDLRDVFVSKMRKDSLTFKQLWDRSFVENTLDVNRHWTRFSKIMISSYEVMINCLADEVKRIANHLGIPVDRNYCDKIASDYTLQKQQKRIGEFKSKFVQDAGTPAFDPHSLLHSNHIHSGGTGDWKNALTSMQVVMIEKKAGEWLVANGYELSQPSLNFFERIFGSR